MSKMTHRKRSKKRCRYVYSFSFISCFHGEYSLILFPHTNLMLTHLFSKSTSTVESRCMVPKKRKSNWQRPITTSATTSCTGRTTRKQRRSAETPSRPRDATTSSSSSVKPLDSRRLPSVRCLRECRRKTPWWLQTESVRRSPTTCRRISRDSKIL